MEKFKSLRPPKIESVPRVTIVEREQVKGRTLTVDPLRVNLW